MHDELPVLLIGLGPEARWVADVLTNQDRVIYGHLSLSAEAGLSVINDIPTLGELNDQTFQRLLQEENIEYVLLEADPARRLILLKQVFALCNRLPINVVHPFAHVSPYAHLEQGNVLMEQVALHPNAKLGALNVLSSGCVVETDAQLGSANQLGAHVVVGRGATLGNESSIGAGAIIYQGITLGDGVLVAPGSVVMRNVPDGAQVFGNPAKTA